MNIVTSHASKGKLKHPYVYAYYYPEDYPEPCLAGTAFYIGKGQGDRINAHLSEARTGKTYNTYKVRIIKKIWNNGGEVVKVILAYFETHEEACMYEIALIFFMDGLTNLTYGGEGTLGLPSWNKGQKGLQVAWNKGIPPSPEVLERLHKMSEARRGKPVTFTEAHRLHLSEATKRTAPTRKPRRPYSEETLRRKREAQQGRPHTLSEDGRRRLVESNKRRRGKPRKPYSEEALRNIREGAQRRKERKRNAKNGSES